MRESEIKSTEDLSEWIHRQGPEPGWDPNQRLVPGAHSPGAVQVARPSQSAGVPTGIATRPPIWTTRAQNTRSPAESLPTINGAGSTTCHWRTCLTADLESCRAASLHLRGRFRQAARCALEARHNNNCGRQDCRESGMDVVLFTAILETSWTRTRGSRSLAVGSTCSKRRSGRGYSKKGSQKWPAEIPHATQPRHPTGTESPSCAA